MINKHIEFSRCMQVLKRFDLRVQEETPNRCAVVDVHSGDLVIEFHDLTRFFGFCECLRLVESGDIDPHAMQREMIGAISSDG